MNEKAWTGYADNRYAEQRSAGFPWLRFAPELEREYGESARNRFGARLGIALAVALAAGSICALLGRAFIAPRDWVAVYACVVTGLVTFYLLAHAARMEFLLRQELQQQAVLDGLTGLMNRRAFTAHLDSAWLQAQRSLTSIGMMLLDLDQFKSINDTCGHPFGDNALQHVAQVLRRSALRPLDAAARYGGDEFIAIWYDVDGTWLARLAQEMPARLAGLKCGGAAAPLEVKVSGGVVLAWPRPGIAVQDAIKAADELLYETKRATPGTIGYRVLRPPAQAPAPEQTRERTAA